MSVLNSKFLLLTFKALHQQAPTYVQDLVSRYSPPRTLRSSNSLRLNPVIFNRKSSLPDNIRSCDNLSTFKSLHKTYYSGEAQIEWSKRLVLTQKCNRHAIRANVNKASKQAKRGVCLPCERHSTLRIHCYFKNRNGLYLNRYRSNCKSVRFLLRASPKLMSS